MLSLALIASAILAVAARASATAIEHRAASPDCVTKLAGVLSASITQSNKTTFKSFTLSTVDQVAYLGDGASPLVVQFQQCASLNNDFPTDNAASGRLYVPAKGKCITITNQSKATAPYYTTLATCGIDYPQRFGVYYNDDNKIYWTGESDEEGSILQGGCGILGYKGKTDGTPIITHTNEQTTLECDSKIPFRIVTTVA